MNWNVTLISAKFLEGTGDTADAIRALDYLTDLKVRHGLQIVASNNSWGGGGSSQALTDAINRGGDQGILFVAAAGNDSVSDDGAGAFYPAAGKCDRHYPSGAARGWDCIVSVAAITKTGTLADYSNFGAVNVDLGAPGSDILSTYPPSQYAWIDGTSMAAPHVTGALALLASCSFGLTPSQLRADLLAAATTTSSLAGKTSTGKRLDIARLISTYCSAPGPPTAIVTGPSGIGVGSSFAETVWFSHAVTGLVKAAFSVGGTSGGWGVSGVTGSGAGPYTVSLASAAPTEGTVTLTLAANSVTDGTSMGPALATAGPVVHIDRTAPHAVVILPAGPTKVATLTATLSFDEGIMGLTAADLSVSGTARGCSIGDPIDGLANKSFTVQVGGCGEGTVALTLAAGSISDLSANAGPAAPATSGVVTIDRTPAVATLTPPATPTAAATPLWTLSFNEAVRSAIPLGRRLRPRRHGDRLRRQQPDADRRRRPMRSALSGCGSGTVTLELKAGSMTDLAGNVSPAGPADAAAIVVDHALPTTSSPGISTRTGIAVSGTTIPISASWTGADTGSGVARYQIQRSVNGGAFTWVSTNLATPPVGHGPVIRRADPAPDPGRGCRRQCRRVARGLDRHRAARPEHVDRHPLRRILGDELVVVVLGRVGEGLVDRRRERHLRVHGPRDRAGLDALREPRNRPRLRRRRLPGTGRPVACPDRLPRRRVADDLVLTQGPHPEADRGRHGRPPPIRPRRDRRPQVADTLAPTAFVAAGRGWQGGRKNRSERT